MLEWTLNSRVKHDSGHYFEVVHVDGKYAVLRAEADGLFGACVLTDDLACGFNVLHTQDDEYAEFYSLNHALSYLMYEKGGDDGR